MEPLFNPEEEQEFVAAFLRDREAVVALPPADSFMQAQDRVREYVFSIIEKYDIAELGSKPGEEVTVCNGRYTKEHGHHYYVHTYKPKK